MTDDLPPLPLPAKYQEEGTSGIDYTADQMRAQYSGNPPITVSKIHMGARWAWLA